MRKKPSYKIKHIKEFVKNLTYLKNNFVSKESFSRENALDGASTIFIESRSKIVIEGGQNSCVRHFFRGMLTVS